MENQEILIKILEELKVGESQFINSLVQGELISAISLTVIHIVVLIAMISLYKKFNNTFYVKENVESILSVLKEVIQGNSMKKPRYDTDKITAQNEIGLMVKDINDYFKNHQIWRYITTVVVIWIEFKWFVINLSGLVNNAIKILQCLYAQEKIVIDYLSSLF